jgi:hypothetical protein
MDWTRKVNPVTTVSPWATICRASGAENETRGAARN